MHLLDYLYPDSEAAERLGRVVPVLYAASACKSPVSWRQPVRCFSMASSLSIRAAYDLASVSEPPYRRFLRYNVAANRSEAECDAVGRLHQIPDYDLVAIAPHRPLRNANLNPDRWWANPVRCARLRRASSEVCCAHVGGDSVENPKGSKGYAQGSAGIVCSNGKSKETTQQL